MNLLQHMDLPYRSISHDLDVAMHICNQVVVKYVSIPVDILEVYSVVTHPRRPLTATL